MAQFAHAIMPPDTGRGTGTETGDFDSVLPPDDIFFSHKLIAIAFYTTLQKFGITSISWTTGGNPNILMSIFSFIWHA